MNSCTFYFMEFLASDGGGSRSIETDGVRVEVDSPFHYASGENVHETFFRIELRPGQCVFVRDVTRSGEFSRLIIPPIGQRFQEFIDKSRLAGEAVYSKIKLYKGSSQSSPGDYGEDFSGDWLSHFVTKFWDSQDLVGHYPKNLAEALERLKAPPSS